MNIFTMLTFLNNVIQPLQIHMRVLITNGTDGTNAQYVKNHIELRNTW